MTSIYSWNVNGLRAVERKKALQEFITKHSPDILLLQEIKGKVEQFSEYLTDTDTYEKHYHSAEKAGYSGVAVWVRQDIKDTLGDTVEIVGMPPIKEWNDSEGRVLRVDFQNSKLTVLSIYIPNGGKSDEAFIYKLNFFKLLGEYLDTMKKEGRIFVLGGDFNVAHKEIDLEEPEKHKNNVGFREEIREKLDTFIKNKKLIDTYRHFYKDKKGAYTYWDNFDFSLPRGTTPRFINRGWRLDYLFMENSHLSQLKSADIKSDILGSDHCPVSIEIELE